ncbi:Transposase IS200 like [Andreprevotia lacus DSM 23236]|jgi:putative transposase|uniref:Transposase IS200 like n=1 Tax=Andreprevotia lacus DSM 23236 TaxID=1121001 RepID=A0A1W1XV25_9NEIS|nr:transposase [Andreprevotia lacus]SMC27715.1 Transposase IS200 like [Andreprevotia lacus DSM 23236]
MPRRARVYLPGVPLHLIQRGNNRQACFFADEDYRVYLDWLKEYAGKTGCAVHAYVLMTNHVHLLLSSSAAEGNIGGQTTFYGRQFPAVSSNAAKKTPEIRGQVSILFG